MKIVKDPPVEIGGRRAAFYDRLAEMLKEANGGWVEVTASESKDTPGFSTLRANAGTNLGRRGLLKVRTRAITATKTVYFRVDK